MIGYIDESVRQTGAGLMYVTAAAVLADGDPAQARASLRKLLLPHQQYLHWRDESLQRREVLLAEVLRLDLRVYAVAAHPVRERRQERARARTLKHLLYLLAVREGVHDVIIEARDAIANRRDALMIIEARRPGTLPATVRFEHQPKSHDALLWAADIVVSALATDLTTRTRPYFLALQPALLHLEQIDP